MFTVIFGAIAVYFIISGIGLSLIWLGDWMDERAKVKAKSKTN